MQVFNPKTWLARGILLLVLLLPGSGWAEGLEESVEALGAKGFKQKIAAIEQLGALADARAIPVLKALQSGRLFRNKADGKLVIGEKSGRVYLLSDPITQAELGQAPKKQLKKVRVNNRLRGVIKNVLGALNLAAEDPDLRIQAADALFKSTDAAHLNILAGAIDREEDADVRDRMERAMGAITLRGAGDDSLRAEALRRLSDFSDPEVRSLLAQIADSVEDPLADKARAAMDEIDRDLAIWQGVGNLFQGVSLGSVLLLAAVGLAITFGVMGVINMAHGELVMLGAYTTFVVQEIFRSYMPNLFDWSLMVAVPMAFLVSGAVGIAMERSVIRFLYGRPLETLLATWGISLVLQQAIRSIFGPTNQEVGSPDWMSGAIETGTGLVLTYNRISIIIFSLAVVALLALIMRRTSLGLEMRAVTQNRRMAASMGIRTDRVDALTFGLGAGVAGMAGVALSQIDNVSPNLGQAYIIDSFMVVVFGGVGNLWGTVVGAFSLGILNKFLEPFAGAVLAKILVLVGIILFIQKRPRGLFALKGRAIES